MIVAGPLGPSPASHNPKIRSLDIDLRVWHTMYRSNRNYETPIILWTAVSDFLRHLLEHGSTLSLTTHDAIAISVDTISVQTLLQAPTTESGNSELEKIGGEIERYLENLASRFLHEVTYEMANIKLKYVNKVCKFVVGCSLVGSLSQRLQNDA